MYDSKGYDLKDIMPNMELAQIEEIINNKVTEKLRNQLLKEGDNLNNPQFEMLKNYNLDLAVFKFFLNKIKLDNDISIFLRPDIGNFSLEQIRYLFSVYSTDTNIESIFDSNLSVEQMREKVSMFSSSQDFIQEITERANGRKNK